jgi:pSer/pThr/pTyr-binding forkhead associated (FHA) protein
VRATALIVTAGPSVGKRFALEPGISYVGSAANAAIPLSPTASQTHAVLEVSPEGSVRVRNRSPRGTLVNGAPIDVAVLSDGDVVQFGNELALRVQAGLRSGKVTSKNSQREWFRRPGLIVALGGYLLAMAALAAFLSSQNSEPAVLDMGQLNQATQSLTSGLIEGRTSFNPLVIRELGNTDVPLTLGPVARSALPRPLAESIGRTMSRALLDASALENQQRRAEAEDAYRTIIAAVPDPDSPVSRIAAARLSGLLSASSTQ